MAKKRPPVSSDCDDSPPPAKRGRQNMPATVEKLPTEILQQIFFASLNGNLLKASPRIAVKLSRSQNIYRTSFFIAFYHHKLIELRKEFRFEYLLPEVEVPLPFWELRSMVKAVLDSRWCKWSWVKNLLLGLRQKAALTFIQDYASRRYRYPERLVDGLLKPIPVADCLRSASSQTYGLTHDIRPCFGTGRLGAENELRLNLFNVAIASRPAGSNLSDYDDEGYPWELTVHWQLELYAFGYVPLETAKLNDFYVDDTRFCDLIHRSFGICGISDRHKALGMWQRLEGRLYSAIAGGDVKKLRHLLQIDYFLRPEDVAYHLPTRLFRAAALSDINLKHLQYDEGGVVHVQFLLHVLFSIDPHSLPRLPCNEVSRWALLAQDRIRRHASERHAIRVDSKWDLKDDDLSEHTKREIRNCLREKEYNYNMDIEILRCLTTTEPGKKPAMMSPNFAGPVLWLPNEVVDEKEILAEDDEELKVVREMSMAELQTLVGGLVSLLDTQ